MVSFLEHVAEELLSKFGTDLSRVAVVFPNKRASLFLNDYLAHQAERPLWSPAYITISDLFRSHSRLQVADPILLVCELHKCFTRCTGIDETLDHFYGWGQLLLSDFDDLDKNMGPADRVFANLRDIHELDDVSYLTDEQRKLIQRFFSNFSDDHNSELKQRFLRLWSHIGDIYHTFNEQLAAQGLAYEGALYRQVAEDETVSFEYDTYVFVGFNLLQQVEQTLFRRLEREGKAIFYQDTEEQPPRQLTFISAPTENIQARYVSQWLTPERIADGRRTAVVLCNEGLLQAVIHCLPDTVDKVNVTTGYPLLQTPVASLVSQLLNLQVNGFSARTQSFRQRWLNIVARHPYAALLSEDYASAHLTDSSSLLHWLLDIVRTIKTDSDLQSESIFKMYTLLNRLSDLTDSSILTVDVPTLQRLVLQVVQSTSIPFHGEPAEGIQVMGVLETRNLDFDHVLLLSCNEGNMPRGVNDTSFIPYAIRKAYGLTTIDYKVAIYQHYFHRLLQRAEDVTIVYNNATIDAQKGEMSRFMLQLMVERGDIEFRSLHAGQQPLLRQPQSIDKTPAVLDILRRRFSKDHGGISPTAVSTYLRCQLRFFYRYVSNLQEPDDTDEDLIDNRLFGIIFHESARTLYDQFIGRQVTSVLLDDLLKDEVTIERAVDTAISNTLGLHHLDGLQLINREVIIKYMRLLIETDRRLTPFTILGLEKRVDMPWGDTKVGGIIDRLDCITDSVSGEERIRVIDYKTGARHLRPMPNIEAIFDPDQIPNHSDYYLQAFLYSHIVRQHRTEAVSPALLFIQHAAAEGYDPTLVIGRDPVTDITVHSDRFIALFKETTDAIFSPDLHFTPTDDRNRCRSCPYAALCGR
ncbi:MAG: PD-(D/E)XK nuclease family protein [Prevotella sp.]|nr:PD-(D/E)XK nuclease family protein [Prevotella sp.]